MEMLRGISAVASAVMMVCVVASNTAQAQQVDGNTAPRAAASRTSSVYLRANQGTVGIISGGIDSTSISAASDLSQVLDDGDKLRIIPVIGRGSVQNISDILYLKGIDIGIVQSDVLSFFKRTKRLPGINQRLRYITKLYNEEFHVLANMKYTCINDLGGRRVNFGIKDSGTAMTAEAVFNAHDVKVQRSFFDQATAIDKLKKGELDAIVIVSGKPSRGFDKITYKDRVHFLDVTYVNTLQKDYLPATITYNDYPDLVAPQEKVETISVGAVMAVYNWPVNHERFRKVSRFIDAFFSKFSKFQVAPRHPKWKEVNLNSTVPGWQRFAGASNWLKRNSTATPRVASTSRRNNQSNFQRFLSSVGGDINKLSSSQKEQLFKQFMRWQSRQNN